MSKLNLVDGSSETTFEITVVEGLLGVVEGLRGRKTGPADTGPWSQRFQTFVTCEAPESTGICLRPHG